MLNMAALAKPSMEFTALLNMVSMTSKEQLHYLLMLEDMFKESSAQLSKFNDFAAMTPKEQLRYLLKKAKWKILSSANRFLGDCFVVLVVSH